MKNNVFSHSFKICHGEISLKNQYYATIHFRYDKLPDDLLKEIVNKPGVVEVFNCEKYSIGILVGECFVTADITAEICNKIMERWIEENGELEETRDFFSSDGLSGRNTEVL